MTRAEIIANAQVALFPEYRRECKRDTHDGRIWPLSRAAMRNPAAIRERMAEDLQTLIRQRGAQAVIITEDYLRLGWRREQVETHGLAAARVYAETNHAGTDRARDLANEVA